MADSKIYQVNTGFYSEHEMYRGSSLFRAGLVAAKARRDGATLGLNVVTFCAPELVDLDDDGLDDKEREFLDDCHNKGSRFRNRKKVCA